MTLEIREVVNDSDRQRFVRVPAAIMRDDRDWVEPYEPERLAYLDPDRGPFFEHGEAQLFLAMEGRHAVGRISAQWDRLHLERYGDATGFFGFFDSCDDDRVVGALVDAAADWLRARGLRRMLGPYGFNINGDVGLLVSGGGAPYVGMPYNPPYYAAGLERHRLRKAHDVLAWQYAPVRLAPRTEALAARALADGGVRVRRLSLPRLDEDIAAVVAIFNEAWAENWGYLPLTREEAVAFGTQVKAFIDPRIAFFIDVEGEPAGMSVSLPDVNAILHGLGGCRSLLSRLRLLWRLKTRGTDRARALLIGLRPRFRSTTGTKGLAAVLLAETHRAWRAAGYRLGEISWTLEDNTRINQAVAILGGTPYRTYRIYEAPL